MRSTTVRDNLQIAPRLWGQLPDLVLQVLQDLSGKHLLSIASGDLLYLDGKWYVTHSGLLGIARRKRCSGIQVRPVIPFCDPVASRWAFRATVYKSPTCKGFVGYGDADPSNVSPLVHGAEMRIAETRAVNRALRKAYGIGICSVEEIGLPPAASTGTKKSERRPPQRVNGNGSNGQPRLRDRLCQLIREHQLDPLLVKSYALDFCGTKNLNEASREQIENFINQLADQAEKEKDALLCQLNSYAQLKQDGAA